MIRYNELENMKEVGSNETMATLNSLDRAKKKLMKELIPPNSNPTVKTIVTSSLKTILEWSNEVREPTSNDSGREYTGMTQEQAEEFIGTIKAELDKMLSHVIFYK